MQTIVGREFQKINVASLQCRVGLTFTSMLDSQRFWKNWAVRTYIEMDFLIHLPDKVQLWPWMLKTLEQNGTQSSARYRAREEDRGGREEAGGSTWSHRGDPRRPDGAMLEARARAALSVCLVLPRKRSFFASWAPLAGTCRGMRSSCQSSFHMCQIRYIESLGEKFY